MRKQRSQGAKMSRISAARFMDLTRKTTPLAEVFDVAVQTLEAGQARLRLPFRSDFMRAGGTVSGPAMMMLADYALYAVIMSVAENGEGAVTSNLNTTFLRRPKPAAVIAEARLIRCGKRLAYGEVTMFSEGDEQEPVAHATGTYALPPDKPR
jgi:uncharacterized protein (TIGR00369 family)